MVKAGRRFAKSSNSFRSATFTERNPLPTGVVSGPLSASFRSRMLCSVPSGIGVPAFSTAAMPATCSSQSKATPVAESTFSVAAVISGPIPSPGIRVA